MHYVIRDAYLDDAAALHALQKIAFASEGRRYHDLTIAPLIEAVETVQADLAVYTYLVAEEEQQIIGAVRGRVTGGTCHIGRLIVHPDKQKRGVGSALMNACEKRFDYVERYELFTGVRSVEPLRLYKNRGYTPFKTGNSECGSVELLYMHKRRGQTGRTGNHPMAC